MKKVIVTMLAVALILWGKHTQAFGLNEIEIHGFVSQGYMKSDKNNFLAETKDGTFQFNEMGINFSADLAEKLRMGIQFFSSDLGDLNNNKIKIDWAFADYRWKDWLGFRAGKIKKALGFYNEIRDTDMLRTNILLPQSVYLESQRDAMLATQGIGIYGNIPINPVGSLSYQVQYGTMDIDEDSGTAKDVEIYGIDVAGFDVEYVFDGSLEWETPLPGLRIKGSMTTLDMDINANTTVPMGPVPIGTPMTIAVDDFRMYIYSAEYTWKNLVLTSECLHMEMKRDMGMGLQKQESLGYYINASYRFTDWFELGAYYTVFYPDIDDRHGDKLKTAGRPEYRAWQKDGALSLRFDINNHWTFKLEGHSINGTGLASARLNTDADKDWFLFLAKATFSF